MNIVIKSLLLIFLMSVLQFGSASVALANPRGIGQVRMAVETAVRPIVKSAGSYVEQKTCFTCHHQALPVMAAVRAETIGVKVDRKWLETQRKFTADFFLQRKVELVKGHGVPGGAFTAGYAIAQFVATSQITASGELKRLEGTDELLDYLLKIYKPERPWKINTIRPPLESSDFTATGLAIAALSTYKLEELMKHAGEIRTWYASTTASSAEDRAFQLMGWYWLTKAHSYHHALKTIPDYLPDRRKIGKKLEQPAEWGYPGVEVDTKRLQAMVDQLKQRQREDGGWAQTDAMQSDAYATGIIMTALLTAQPDLAHAKWYLRGVNYLLETQKKDGSWLVLTRSRPIQEYFESDFPHGEDQFISISASCWSVIALSQYVHILSNRRK
ncbi:MAG: hypothetical protein CMM02_17670 [Rhodopirellula sp.]|nr:hypothetical protein [Rhodopirellula sp.]|tara:strand:+ start:296 stop:1453 length:1158 start_codon:yes stop_codon:yes gene_type:complete